MLRFLVLAFALALLIIGGFLTAAVSPWWLWLSLPAMFVVGVGVWDLLQTKHSVLRNYPVMGHFRFWFESVRPEFQQYFIESDTDGRPFDRVARSLVYERAKGANQEKAFGTELDVYEIGQEFLVHSMAPRIMPSTPHRVVVGGPQCRQPYSMALLNVSAMSFGSLSANAVLALNKGAKLGGFAHDTGEGGLSRYHLEPGGDLVWEIGSAYFGCRTASGAFDVEQFAEKASSDQVKCISIKLSQGAKPGIGGVMPAAKMTLEIARARGVPVGVKCVSPAAHSAFEGPTGLMEFVALLRERSGGKPTGFKLCVGNPVEFLSVCKAILATEILPDFIIVDGSEGGTGAAPVEFEDHMGMPLTNGLIFVHNALIGIGVRDRVRIGASGKIASGADIVKRLIQGADYTNAARAMMMALGCIQAQRCHTNTCPVGVTTQDPIRTRALVISDKARRVARFQEETVASAAQLIAAMGLAGPEELRPNLLMRRTGDHTVRRYDEIHHPLTAGQLLSDPPGWWANHWGRARADRYGH